ncbi:MAG: response regulator [Brasilonema angustatum HA4187-MV1]|nr:response regulator [Brasilonema angustatum HA4187-MV1]
MDELQFLNGLQVLVVDDDVDNLDLIKFILEEYKTEVIVATSVTEGLQVMTWFNPDILISDIAMPNCDGYSLIRSVRNLSEHVKHIPAIALTGQASDEARTLALQAGFSTHLKKPFDPDELIVLVSKLVEMASLKNSCGNNKVEPENDGTKFSLNVA